MSKKDSSQREKEIGKPIFLFAMLHVEKFDFNSFDDLYSNAYIVSDSKNRCLIIDPSVDNDTFIKYINKNNLLPQAILLTHGHFDHIQGVKRLVESYKIPIYIHKKDEIMLRDSKINGGYMCNKEVTIDLPLIYVEDKEVLKLIEDDIQVLHTPFHTKGSVCYYFINNNLLFTGDTLFKNSVGRDDLPNADPQMFKSSISKIKALPKDCKIYPGHGNNTVLIDELNYNYFLSK